MPGACCGLFFRCSASFSAVCSRSPATVTRLVRPRVASGMPLRLPVTAGNNSIRRSRSWSSRPSQAPRMPAMPSSLSCASSAMASDMISSAEPGIGFPGSSFSARARAASGLASSQSRSSSSVSPRRSRQMLWGSSSPNVSSSSLVMAAQFRVPSSRGPLTAGKPSVVPMEMAPIADSKVSWALSQSVVRLVARSLKVRMAARTSSTSASSSEDRAALRREDSPGSSWSRSSRSVCNGWPVATKSSMASLAEASAEAQSSAWGSRTSSPVHTASSVPSCRYHVRNPCQEAWASAMDS
ncbi:hypothetical protein ACFFX0_12050 [Citricoccus parietis]|uniref:Uncharacterized protein n=1 Tax=Citricoccus parietis TaxID=592307 RepID=A0ABV5FYY0_9MICC